MVRIYVGNTDPDWFDFLASLGIADEINFWKPSAGAFNAISEGERFAFRLKSPRNKIGGFGTFAKSSLLPIHMAWETFGIRNGVSSEGDLINAIARYRPNEKVTSATFIVCRVIVDPIFLPPELWFDVPNSWAGSIVQGKTYSGESAEGSELWTALEEGALAAGHLSGGGVSDSAVTRFGKPILIPPRLGQGAFRVAITELYGRQCAMTEGKVLPALDAAHIRPYSEGGLHAKSNGILLRKDIHSVFDAGYATIDSDYRFVVSEKVRDIFNNGNEYRRLHGVKMRLPVNPMDRPSPESLRWHNENRYLG
jgi:putative restriction endonuclease